MTETQHTPGPWTWDRPPISYDDVFRSLHGPDGQPVFHLRDVYPGYPECGEDLVIELSNEDAALIAAATDLLAACEDLLHHFCGGGEQVMSDFEVMQIARAAIAKAKGQQP